MSQSYPAVLSLFGCLCVSFGLIRSWGGGVNVRFTRDSDSGIPSSGTSPTDVPGTSIIKLAIENILLGSLPSCVYSSFGFPWLLSGNCCALYRVWFNLCRRVKVHARRERARRMHHCFSRARLKLCNLGRRLQSRRHPSICLGLFGRVAISWRGIGSAFCLVSLVHLLDCTVKWHGSS